MNKKIEKMIMVLLVMSLVVCSAFVPQDAKAAAQKQFSVTSAYSNPEGSGTITAEADNGAIYYTNGAINKRKLVAESVAADNDPGNQEVCLGIDQYGTVWVIYKNQAIYWYNLEIIGKKGVIQKWKGEDNSKDIKAIRLGANGVYADFKTATHYTSGKTLEDVVLPDFKTLYKAFNEEEYKASVATPTPTPVPLPTATVTPVITPIPPVVTPVPATPVPDVPTATPTSFVPTRKPTATPTIVPTLAPGATPSPTPYVVAEIDSHTTIDMVMEWWEEVRKQQEADWDILKKRLTEIGATIDGQSVTIATEEYEYDPVTKQLIRKVTKTVGNETKTISGQVSTNEQETGHATVTSVEQTHGLAELQGTIDTHTTVAQPNPIKVDVNGGGSGGSSNTKFKTHYYGTTDGNYRSLVRIKSNGKAGRICKVYFNKKKKIARFDKVTFKGVTNVRYTNKSRQIVMTKTNRKAIVVARAKGKAGQKYKVRTLKGKWDKIVCGVNKLALRLVNTKTGEKLGVSNVQPIKVKATKKTKKKKTTKKKTASTKKNNTKKSAATKKKTKKKKATKDKVTTADGR